MEHGEYHLDVFEDRFEFHYGNDVEVYRQGPQSANAQARYRGIKSVLEGDYLNTIYDKVCSPDYIPDLDKDSLELIKSTVDSMTSENGRALIGLLYQQMCIKAIEPTQSIRLHKGGPSRKQFSWVEGISMRSIDSKFITPFLRSKDLLKMNKDGVMMTRTLAENYPYSPMYKAELRGPVKQWLQLIELLENGLIDAEKALLYLTFVLKNQSDSFQKLCDNLLEQVKHFDAADFQKVKSIIVQLFETSSNHARIFEISIHAFMQAMSETGFVDGDLVPLSQMRSANKKHDNVGDVEIAWNNSIQESWDAKYGKPYLLDELYELQDKINNHNSVEVAGFITNVPIQRDKKIDEVITVIESENEVDIRLFDFDDWIAFQIGEMDKEDIEQISKRWLTDLTETLCQKRRNIAPVDEPCDEWIINLGNILREQK